MAPRQDFAVSEGKGGVNYPRAAGRNTSPAGDREEPALYTATIASAAGLCPALVPACWWLADRGAL